MNLPAPPTQAAQPSPASLSDADLIKSINDKTRAMLHAYRSSIGHAIEVGELLKEAKARVGHGNFEPWLREHCNLSKLIEKLKELDAKEAKDHAGKTIAARQRYVSAPPAAT